LREKAINLNKSDNYEMFREKEMETLQSNEKEEQLDEGLEEFQNIDDLYE
jgi:hypothetical protein